MTFGEFRSLLGCTAEMVIAVATVNTEKLKAVQTRVEVIHAEINKRNAAK